MFKAYFRSDPASHSALTRCAFSESDIVSFHSATIVGLKLSKPHDHNSVKLAMGGMPEHGMRLQHHVAAYAEPYGQTEQASKLTTAMLAALIKSDCELTNQGRWS